MNKKTQQAHRANEALLALPQVAELEILAFCRRKLAATVYTLAPILGYTVVAIHARDGLALGNKMRIAVLELAGAGHLKHAFEINHALIPPWKLLVEVGYYR